MTEEETTRQERLDKMIGKVEGLLKKASHGNTTPEEAEAFFAKAQELMTKHGIEETMLSLGQKDVPVEQVIENDMGINRSGFFDSMVSLASACADANGVKVLIKMPKSFGTDAGVRFIGFESDIIKTKMLYVSLLAQCVRERRTVPEYVKDIEMSQKGYIQRWRRDFSVGYASRIRERLMEVKRAEEAAADKASDGRLLPALIDKAALVQEAYDNTGKSNRRAGGRRNGPMSDAFHGGRSAADRANIGGSTPNIGGSRTAIGN